MCSAKDRYTLIEQSSNSRITCMQYSQKNFMRVIIKRIMGRPESIMLFKCDRPRENPPCSHLG